MCDIDEYLCGCAQPYPCPCSCVLGLDNPQCLCQRVAAQCPQIAARSLIYTQNEIAQAKDVDRDTDTDTDMNMTHTEHVTERERDTYSEREREGVSWGTN